MNHVRSYVSVCGSVAQPVAYAVIVQVKGVAVRRSSRFSGSYHSVKLWKWNQTGLFAPVMLHCAFIK